MVKMLRLKQRSYRTEQTYLGWFKQFYRFHGDKAPDDLTTSHVIDFLSYMAVERKIAKSTQDLALNALLFFYRFVLNKELGNIRDTVRATKKKRLPTVLSTQEVLLLFDKLSGINKLMAQIIYGGGLRIGARPVS